jgi:hypothetical protein
VQEKREQEGRREGGRGRRREGRRGSTGDLVISISHKIEVRLRHQFLDL